MNIYVRNVKKLKWNVKKIPWLLICFAVVFLLTTIFLWISCIDSTQELPADTPDVTFQGDYRIGDGEWSPIRDWEHISATDGDVTLRGTFCLLDPDTGDVIGNLSTGTRVAFHLSHIGCTVYAPNRSPYVFDCELEEYEEDACGFMILPYTYFSDSEDVLTIVLHNPHKFGNENAVDHFLDSLALYNGSTFESEVINQGDLQRTLGMVVIIAGVLVLGIALFTSLLYAEDGKSMCFISLMMIFAGSEFLFSVHGVSLWSRLVVLNTVAHGLCMMFYVLMLMVFICYISAPYWQKKIRVLVYIMTFVTATVTLASISKDIRFYDTYIVWFGIFLILSPFLSISLIYSLFKGEKKYISMIVLSHLAVIAIIVDMYATQFGLWQGGVSSRFIFIAMCMACFITVLRVLPKKISDAERAKVMENTQKNMMVELQESRISIVLSQIKPHFLFNALNSIYYLCEKDPVAAQTAIGNFSDYLRDNLENLQQTELIPFYEEMEHVNTYLNLEKVRFGNELEVVYELPVVDFVVPVLTIQPLVENAVKHGTSRKRGGGTVYLITKETEKHYEIIVRDTGVGFDPEGYESDGVAHVGLTNVRNRLMLRCQANMVIDSKIGEGTTVMIQIPKERKAPDEDTRN